MDKTEVMLNLYETTLKQIRETITKWQSSEDSLDARIRIDYELKKAGF